MAHVEYVEPDEVAHELEPVFERLAARTGLVLNFYRAMAHHPELLRSFLALDASLQTMSLDPAVRELAYLAVSMTNGCDYDQTYHHAPARKAGLTERQVQDLEEYETSDAYDDRQREVIRYAVRVSRNLQPDEHLGAQIRRMFPDRELVELTATIALANFTNRFAMALLIELP